MGLSFETDRLALRELSEDDVSNAYLQWLNDPEINQYLETRFHEQTLVSIRAFVASKVASDKEFLFGIFFEGRHVGNIKLGPINPWHKLADVSYFIGARDMWGKGIATEAIRGVTAFGFRRFDLNKLSAGVYAPNAGSSRALEKAGYSRESVRRQHYFFNGAPCDIYDYGLLRSECEEAG